ncbi:uncharacterized protein C2orf42 homolog isoform X2 [Euwallacea fornicatus]|uniref:uncharacterized protein C2orf42 homolog isoform X2 n=1 Tax=Euwallacea fornicatus TaxID=995702 RepID=UPI00338D615F
MDSFNITVPNILQGLGKSTRRGIKKCPHCGTFNGTKGTYCKNKECRVSLRTASNSSFDFDAVKLVTGTFRQVFSVHVKDAVSECRGFVQLPLHKFCAKEKVSEVALCFVDSCQRSFDNSILKCHEEEQNGVGTEKCVHINLALKSQAIAKPINFDGNVLNQLRIPYQIKEKLKLLAEDNESPLVQQVSRNVMAVKCQVTPKQPLGYLHFTFMKGRNNRSYEKYFCSCTEYFNLGIPNKTTSIKNKCIHYYACIAALTSDPSAFEEFSNFINNELHLQDKRIRYGAPKVTKEIETIDIKRNRIKIISNCVVKKPTTSKKDIIKSSEKKAKFPIRRCKNIVPKIYPIEIKVLNDSSSVADSDINWSLVDWLAFVTESINRTMQFINCGIINSQVFYIPEVFFHSFRKRIPDTYETQATEIGSVFYSIMNINHVKEIFDTPKVKLRIAKKFIHVEDKGYIEYDENSENDAIQYSASFIFFLNVGPSTVDESDNCNNVFVIEWLPNICPITKIGQLKLQYKYGRKGI